MRSSTFILAFLILFFAAALHAQQQPPQPAARQALERLARIDASKLADGRLYLRSLDLLREAEKNGGEVSIEVMAFLPVVVYADAQPDAEQYAQLFQLFRKYADVIARVSFWNLHDGQSWLNDFPWQRVNYPLLFDRNGQPKPAFEAVIKVLSSPNP